MRLLVVCLLGCIILNSGTGNAQSGPPLSQSVFLFFADVSTADLVAGTVFQADAAGRPATRQLSFAWSQPYASPLSASFSLAYSRRAANDRLVVQLHESGSKLYRASGLSLGYYRRLGEKLSAGLLLGVEFTSGDEEMRVFHPMVEGWLKIRLNDKTEAGLYLARLVWMRELQAGGMLQPPAIYAGIRRALTEELSLSSELRYHAEYGISWMTSLHARPSKVITLVAGLDFLNRHIFSGIRFPIGKISCSAGLFYHASLGASPAGSLDFPLAFR